MEQQEEFGRNLWVELLELYDEYIKLGKTDERTIELLENAGLLREGTIMGKEIMDAFPHLDFKTVEGSRPTRNPGEESWMEFAKYPLCMERNALIGQCQSRYFFESMQILP